MSRAIAIAVVFALLAAAVLGSQAEAGSCGDDMLQQKSDDGDILIMMSGAVYEVLPGDNIDSALWLPPADVVICEAPIIYQGRAVMIYEIINTDEAEKVGARRLR